MNALLAYTVHAPELSIGHIASRLAVAGALGAVIGFERERRERAAGLRTHMLVAIGAAAFSIVSAYGWRDYFTDYQLPAGTPPPMRDPTRVAAQIVSGIGFLGGGVILRSGLNVRGLTTAASIWAIGAVGMAAGAGMYALAVLSTVAMFFSLVFLLRINRVLYDRYHQDTVRLSVRLASEDVLKKVMDFVEHQAVEVASIGIEGAGIDTDEELVTVDVTLRPETNKLEVAQKIARMRGVSEVHVKESNER